MIERRKDQRYQLKDHVFAVLKNDSPLVGEIRDISMSGVSFQYIDEDIVNDKIENQMDILLSNVGFRVGEIPLVSVFDEPVETLSPVGSIPMRKKGVKFGPLTVNQKLGLKDIIQNNTVR